MLSAYERHSKTIDAVKWNINKSGFTEAWERYKGDKEYGDSANLFNLSIKDRKLMQYINQGSEKKNRELAIKNIKHLLSFIEKT